MHKITRHHLCDTESIGKKGKIDSNKMLKIVQFCLLVASLLLVKRFIF
ncbi:hypothetical protein PCARR_a2746 [Pseudoalteromonas carrageenovora IAM 12662]|uniref:Uncharacterized protein n=1 Tax=Pseudoalteromonas carrageenovora IAM 12662 TaxID=1314868 RepID=A0ABR9EMD8_PSEVC|nr:hypothetical protein [Pseudoalteromonas carrageenovora IAM 12662]